MDSIEKVHWIIQSSPKKAKTKLIAIDGFGGSGKSTFAQKLAQQDPSLQIVGLDKFPYLPNEYGYHESGVQTRINLERIKKEVLIPLSKGQKARYFSTYWWPTDLKPEQHLVEPGKTVLIEGCYSLHNTLRDFYDLTIWIDCAPNEAMERAIERDGENAREHWEKAHNPNERRYVAVQKPRNHADIILSSTGSQGFVLEKE